MLPNYFFPSAGKARVRFVDLNPRPLRHCLTGPLGFRVLGMFLGATGDSLGLRCLVKFRFRSLSNQRRFRVLVQCA